MPRSLEVQHEPIVDDDLCIRPFEDADVEQFVTAVRESIVTLGPWMPWCHPDYAERPIASGWRQLILCVATC